MTSFEAKLLYHEAINEATSLCFECKIFQEFVIKSVEVIETRKCLLKKVH